MLAFALIKALEIIGEAAVKMSDKYRKSHPEIPWAKIADMRHRLVHAYFEVTTLTFMASDEGRLIAIDKCLGENN